MQNLLIFAKLLQGFPRGNVFPEKLKRSRSQRNSDRVGKAKTAEARGAPAMASQSKYDSCWTGCGVSAYLGQRPFRREPGYLKAPDRIFPQVLSRRFRVAGTFCRQRWFARYARSESLLCLLILA
jgi:hypothetical protein